jgi:hypothetical protein
MTLDLDMKCNYKNLLNRFYNLHHNFNKYLKSYLKKILLHILIHTIKNIKDKKFYKMINNKNKFISISFKWFKKMFVFFILFYFLLK